MRTAALLLCLLAPAAAPVPATDPVADFRLAIEDARAKEAKYFEDYQGNYSRADHDFDVPWLRAGAEPDYPQDATWDYTGFLKIYADFVAIEERRAKAAEDLAAAGGEKAAPALFEELLDMARRADGADAAMEKPMPAVSRFICDLKPGILRHGLGRLEKRLLPALAKCPGATALLTGEGWKRAVALDGRGSIVRRVAVLDTLGMGGDSTAVPFLEKQVAAKGAVIRMAAAQALLGFGPPGAKAVGALLADPCPVVRIALLDGIRARPKPEACWILPVLASYPKSTGRMRFEHVRVLRFLTRQEFGDDADRWKAWREANAAALDGGTFDPAAAPVEKVPAPPDPTGPMFYGLRIESLAPLFLFDASFILHEPAEHDIARTKNRRRWPMRPAGHWDDEPAIHHGVLVREFQRAVDGLLPGSIFGLVALSGPNEPKPFADARLSKPTPRAKADAREFVEKMEAPGWCGPYEGLREAARIARLDPAPGVDDFPDNALAVDTVVLWHSGGPTGGRFITPEPVVEACERLLRFRRLRVVAVRVGNGKEEGEKVMKGIADFSGGACTWAKSPPK